MQLIDTARKGCKRDPAINPLAEEICSRHSLVFGNKTRERLSSLVIGIVSAGGLGSILAEQIMRLFPRRIIIIDKDRIELTNLNRLVGANPVDARLNTRKVDLALRNILGFNPEQDVIAIHGDFLEEENQSRFRECDVIIGGSDSNALRIAANRLCLAHGVVYLDCGTGVIVEKGVLQAAGGQIIKIQPDSGFCLHCSNLFNMSEAMKECLSDGERRRLESQGYIRGASVVAPQVYSLNMMVAAWAVWILMRIVSGEILDFDGVAIDARNLTTARWRENPEKINNCPTCGKNGIVFAGDDCDLLTRDTSEDVPIVLDINEQPRNYVAGSHASAQIPNYEFYFPHYRGVIMGDESGNFLNIKVM